MPPTLQKPVKVVSVTVKPSKTNLIYYASVVKFVNLNLFMSSVFSTAADDHTWLVKSSKVVCVTKKYFIYKTFLHSNRSSIRFNGAGVRSYYYFFRFSYVYIFGQQNQLISYAKTKLNTLFPSGLLDNQDVDPNFCNPLNLYSAAYS